MTPSKPPFSTYIFVCTKQRSSTEQCCGNQGNSIRDNLKTLIKKRKLHKHIRVNHAGCLGSCKTGPNVLVLPQNLWFENVPNTPHSCETLMDTILDKI